MNEIDKKKIAAQCWKRGSEAMVKENWNYAIEMFRQSVNLIPDNLTYRQTLRGVEKRKYKDNGKGAMMASMKTRTVKLSIKKSSMSKDWDKVDQLAEDGLAINPWDTSLNASLADACRKREYDEIAVFCLKEAINCDNKNIALLTQLADILEERGNYQEAIVLWRQITKLKPNDSISRSKLLALEAKDVMELGGYEKAETTKDVKTAYDYDRPNKSNMPQAADAPGMSEEADLKHAIRKEPTNKSHYLKIAEYYRSKKNRAEAIDWLQKALEMSGGDSGIREKKEDYELEVLKSNYDYAKQALVSNPDDEKALKNRNALKKELVKREIEVFSSRVEMYPQNSKLKYELAKRFMLFQKWAQAIPLLQQARADTRIESSVLMALGECFYNDKKVSLAKYQYEAAAVLVNPHDHREVYTQVHYILGYLAEKDGDKKEALEHYNLVLGIDYTYKDTIDRLEKVQGMDDKDDDKDDKDDKKD